MPPLVSDIAGSVIGTFVGLLPIANPFSTAAVFVAITQRFTQAQALSQARRACIYMAIVLLVSLFAGALVMEFFGISIPALRVAGGLIVARIGFGMLHPEPEEHVSPSGKEEALHMEDLAFTPLAMPMLSGPGSIAVTIGMAAGAHHPWAYVGIAVGICAVAYLSWLVLRSAHRIVDWLGPTGMTALIRVMGFLLVCVGVQFIGLGVIETLSHVEVIRAVLDAARTAQQ